LRVERNIVLLTNPPSFEIFNETGSFAFLMRGEAFARSAPEMVAMRRKGRMVVGGGRGGKEGSRPLVRLDASVLGACRTKEGLISCSFLGSSSIGK